MFKYSLGQHQEVQTMLYIKHKFKEERLTSLTLLDSTKTPQKHYKNVHCQTHPIYRTITKTTRYVIIESASMGLVTETLEQLYWGIHVIWVNKTTSQHPALNTYWPSIIKTLKGRLIGNILVKVNKI